MTPFERPDRCRPKCHNKGYMFRAWRTVEADGGKFAETKYRCRACMHEWRERIPAPPEKQRADDAA